MKTYKIDERLSLKPEFVRYDSVDGKPLTEISYRDFLISIFPVGINFGCRIWDQRYDRIIWEDVNSVREPYQLLERAKDIINYWYKSKINT